MARRPWRGIWLRGPRPRSGAARAPERRRGGGQLLLSAVLGIGLALLVIHAFDASVRPLVEDMARAKVKNAVTTAVNDAVSQTLAAEAVAYDDLVSLQKDDAGRIAVMTTNSAKMNALRTQILAAVVAQVDDLDPRELGVPLGNLTGFVTASGRGPVLPVRVLSAAAPDAAFRNVFASAGINQTLHQVMLDVSVPVKLLIPGGAVETAVTAQVCVAETVIVGQVPDAYLELPGGS